MRPAEVLDHQHDLMVRLANPVVSKVWRNQLVLDHRTGTSLYSGLDDEKATSNAAAMLASLNAGLRMAEAFHVTPDMTLMTEHAADSLESTDRIDRTVMPTAAGLARFERGLTFTDVRGRNLYVNWVAWVPIMYRTARHDAGEPDQAVGLWLWNDHHEQPDDMAKMLRETPESALILQEQGRWGLIGCEVLYDGQRLGPPRIETPAEKAEQVISEGDAPVPFSNVLRMAHAFWLLLGQTVVRRREEIPDRSTRKRAERRGLPKRVTVIELRRTEGSRSEGETFVEWSHRWLVRGHWRWQVCSDKHPLAQEIAPGDWRCRIWIAPYVKGPDGKPLVVTDKVYALRR